jgi:hypothetical protein
MSQMDQNVKVQRLIGLNVNVSSASSVDSNSNRPRTAGSPSSPHLKREKSAKNIDDDLLPVHQRRHSMVI